MEGSIGSITEDGLFTAEGPRGRLRNPHRLCRRAEPDHHGLPWRTPTRTCPRGHWAYTAVDYCYANGLVGGISDTEFGPDLHIRRGDFLLMLYGAAGKPAVTSPASLY